MGTSNWEEAPGQTQNSLEGLYIPTGLGMSWDPSGGAGGCHWGEGCLTHQLLIRSRKKLSEVVGCSIRITNPAPSSLSPSLL